MIKEEWRPVVGFEGLYEVSDWGGVRNVKRGRLLNPHINQYGRADVCLYKDGKNYVLLVHRLVAFAFPEICGEWFEGAQANHKDEDPLNNIAVNIEWVTCKYNINYGTRTERAIQHRRKPCGQYKDGVLINKYSSLVEAGEKTGIWESSIGMCCRGSLKMAGGYEWRYL